MDRKELQEIVQVILDASVCRDPDCKRLEVVLKRPEEVERLLLEIIRLTDENKRLKGDAFKAQMKLAENYKLWGLVTEARRRLKKLHQDVSFLDMKAYHDYSSRELFEELASEMGYTMQLKE